jgi:hypothetical protein
MREGGKADSGLLLLLRVFGRVQQVEPMVCLVLPALLLVLGSLVTESTAKTAL